MDTSPGTIPALRRRRWSVIAVVACILAAAVGALFGSGVLQPAQANTPPQVAPRDCAHAYEAQNPVVVENTCSGTTAWQVDHPTGPDHAIEAFTNAASVNVGGQIELFTSTTASTYTFQVFRMGWYQGKGGRLMYTSSTEHGIAQPAPIIDPYTHMVSCDNWTNPVTLPIPQTWVSGIYVVKLLSSDGYIRYTYFVVRDDASRAPILFTSSVITSQAYNLWGGYDLYRGLDAQGNSVPSQRSVIVSFDRPYEGSWGLQNYIDYESSLNRWMEREGYNMTYATDVDIDLSGALLENHRLVLMAGHDEYWSTRMRDNITAARDAGISLGFFGANDVYWHTRMGASPLGADREVTCYKPYYYPDAPPRDTADPVESVSHSSATVLWSDPPLNDPEDSLTGEAYHSGLAAVSPTVLSSDATPFLQGTGLKVGSSIPGTIGGEYDGVNGSRGAPRGVLVLASSPVRCIPAGLCPSTGVDVANATAYTANSGARVFNAGTFIWGFGLDQGWDSQEAKNTNPGFQRFTANIIGWLLR